MESLRTWIKRGQVREAEGDRLPAPTTTRLFETTLVLLRALVVWSLYWLEEREDVNRRARAATGGKRERGGGLKPYMEISIMVSSIVEVGVE